MLVIEAVFTRVGECIAEDVAAGESLLSGGAHFGAVGMFDIGVLENLWAAFRYNLWILLCWCEDAVLLRGYKHNVVRIDRGEREGH